MILHNRLPDRNSQLLIYKSTRPTLLTQPPKKTYNSARIASLDPLCLTSANPNLIGTIKENTADEKDASVRDVEPVADENIPMNFIESEIRTSRYNSNSNSNKDRDLYSQDDKGNRYNSEFFKAIPSLPDCDNKKFVSVLKQKLEICNYICNFYIEDEDVEIKQFKTKYLEEISGHMSKPGMIMHIEDSELTDIVKMCKNNILRRLPVLDARLIFSEDLPPISEPAWLHLNLVYQILRRVFASFEMLPIFNDLSFIVDLLPMLQSPDQNERSTLSSFFQNYLKSKSATFGKILLPHLYKQLTYHVESNSPPFIVGPILTLYLNIFQSQQQENPVIVKVFSQVLRLLGDHHLAHFERQLKSIIDFFTDESCSFAAMFVRSLIIHWPKTCIEKEASFVRMMTEVIPKMSQRDLTPLISRIFAIYAECSTSLSTKVAEAAFQIWTSLQIEPIIQEHSKKIIPLMYSPVAICLREHWNKSVRENAASALRIMSKVAPRTIQEMSISNSNSNNNNNFNNNNYCNNSNCCITSSNSNAIGSNQIGNVSALGGGGDPNRFMPTAHDDLKKWANIARTAARRDRDLNLGKCLAEITMLYNKHQKQQIQMQMMMVPQQRRERAASVRNPQIVIPRI